MSGQEARDDERGELIAELHGVTVVFGDMSPIGNFARRAREAVEAKRPEPEVEYVRGGVCLLCGGAVMDDGSHLDPDRHAEEVESITSGRRHPEPEITDETVRDALVTYLRYETAGKTRAMRAALEAALRVPVGEGEQRGDVSR